MSDRVYLTIDGNYEVGDVVVGDLYGAPAKPPSHVFFRITSLTKSGAPRVQRLAAKESDVRYFPNGFSCTVEPLSVIDIGFHPDLKEDFARFHPSMKAYVVGVRVLFKYDPSKQYTHSLFWRVSKQ